jgi:hypothetical protein
MRASASVPQINVSRIPGGGGVAGALVAISSTLIFLIGIPALRYFLPAAIILGFGIALAIRLVRRVIRRETPGSPWILPSVNSR